MIEVLKYTNNPRISIILTEEERINIAKRVVEFMRPCLRIYGEIKKDNFNGEETRNYYYEYGKYQFSPFCNWVKRINGDFNIKDKDLLDDFFGASGLFERFKNHIRLYGSIYHLNLLTELLGKRVAKSFIEEWAKKSMIVAIILQKYIGKLEEEFALESNKEEVKEE